MIENCESFLRKLFVAVQNSRFYPPHHTLVQRAIEELFEEINYSLKKRVELTIGFVENKFAIDGEPLPDQEAVPEDITKLLSIFGISSVSFRSGLTEGELRNFLSLISTRPENLKENLQTLLKRSVADHIKINHIRYGRIEKEDDREATKSDQKKEATRKTKIDLAGAEDFLRALRSSGGEEAVDDVALRATQTALNVELGDDEARIEAEIQRRVEETTRKLKEENRKLAAEKEKLEAIIKNVGDGVVVVDSEGKILMLNPAAERLLGKKGETLIGDVLKGKIGEEHLLMLSKQTGDERAKEIELMSKSETTTRILRSSNAVVQDKNGAPIGMVAVLSDITKIKEVERLKSEFLANVSHELRSPLVAIQKNLQVLMEQLPGTLTDEQCEFLRLASQNVERLTTLINDLLDISAIEAGKMRFVFDDVDLVAVLKVVAETFTAWIKEKNIDFSLQLPQSELIITADKSRISQVITNLMSNALKFTPVGGKIQLGLVNREEVVEIFVSDSGIGIPEKDLQNIFNRFVRLNTPAASGYGTGLGLSIVKEIVERHNGKVDVQSRVGAGSTFKVVLPVRQQGLERKGENQNGRKQ